MNKTITASFLFLGLAICSFSAHPVPDFGPVCGGVTSTSAVFVVGLQEYGDEAQIVLKKKGLFFRKVEFASCMATEENCAIAKIYVEGLEPSTRYFYEVEINGHRVHEEKHSFRTLPEGIASFIFTFGNSLRLSRKNQSGMLASISEKPLFFLNTGDLHYRDMIMDYPAPYREAIQAVFNTEVHRMTMLDTPLVYMYDDHDYGPNDSDKTAPGRLHALRAYRQVVPHYPMVFPEMDSPITQAFTVGRVRFLMTDLRSERSPNHEVDGPAKTMLGERQLEWFLTELKSAAESHALVFWVSTVPWIQAPKEGADQWGGYTYERERIASYIAKHQIDNLVIIGGDAHSLSADDGSNADYSTDGSMPMVPQLIAAPLDNDSTSVKGGPHSHGTYAAPKGENVYGLVEIEDRGDEIIMKFSGKTHRNEPVIEMAHTVKVGLP